MRTNLFVVEFRRALFPLAVVSLAGSMIVLAIERVMIVRGQDSDSIVGAVNLFLLFGVVLLGYAAGERAFSREFKERELPLLQTLPVPRWKLWLVAVGTHFLSVVACTAAIVVLRPSLLTTLAGQIGVLLVTQTFFFAVTCGFAPLFLRPVVTYAVSAPVALITLIEATGQQVRRLLGYDLVEVGSEMWWFPIGLAGTAIPVLILFYLASSLFFFTRGELLLTRSRLGNGARFLVATILVVLLARGITGGIDTNVEHRVSRFSSELFVHPDGTEVCVDERPRFLSGLRRIVRVDGETGSRIGQFRGFGMNPIGWTADGNRFLIISQERPMLITPDLFSAPRIALYLMDEHGRTRLHTRLGRRTIAYLGPIPGSSDYLVITVEGSLAELWALDTAQIEIRQMASGPTDSFSRVTATSEGLVVRSRGDAGTHTAWLVAGEPSVANQLAVTGDDASLLSWVILDDVLQPRDSPQVVALLDRISRPESRGDRDIYMLPSVVRDDTPIYYVSIGLETHSIDLYVRRPEEEAWTPVATGIPVDQNTFGKAGTISEAPFIDTQLMESVATVDFDLDRHLAVFAVREDDHYRAYLHDAWRDRTVEVGTVNPPGSPQLPKLRFLSISGIVNVTFAVVGDTTVWYAYDPVTGQIERLDRLVHTSSSYLLHRDPSGIEYRRDGAELVRLAPDGSRLVLGSY